ncbi:hypothetical protein ABMA28_015478 [Loxostege sticticalis]|uniref:Protein slender lobes n=1 Tax=Loxostege sticticalis TaxID=481309 RepID=A0ABD0T9Z5_LOXSC
MEEDSGVKAPVTRLRRRLSVESDDVKSPGPATPTKKRGGRLAAKPQLDLIEENAPTPGSATKRSTRKTSVKEMAEAEEKPVTPSRRSTRIKSNTSIVSETTTQVYDSPRAKRAARRTSQVGSDSESAVTPARATRRTRKDSASSVEKLEVTLASKPSNITEVIIEETESSSVKSDDITKGNENASEITPTRRSPRLKGKKQAEKNQRQSIDNKKTEKNQRQSIDKNNVEDEKLNKSSIKDNLNDSKQNHKTEEVSEEPKVLENEKSVSPEKSNMSDSLLMIKELDKKPRKKSSNLNKSTSALDSVSFQSKRQRTKSWTIASHTQVEDGMFYSDNESVKKKLSKKQASKESKNESTHMGSGDHVVNNTANEKSIEESTDEHNTSVQKKSKSESSFSTSKSRISKGFLTPNKSANTSSSALDTETISPEGNKENIQIPKDEDEHNESTKFFEKAPTAILQSTVFFEDSDTDSKGKGKKIHLDTEDQCVPVVDNKLVEEQGTDSSDNHKQSNDNSILNKTNNKDLANDDSCEPMDIDETIPNNTSIADFSQNNLNPTSDDQVPKVQESSVTQSPLINNSLNKSSNKSKRKSSMTNNENLEKTENENKSTLTQIKDVSSTEHNTSKSPKASNEVLSKSRRKSSITKNENLEKTENENKSTLILSQIKDLSSTEHNTSKSPKASNELLSKSVCSASIVKDKALDIKNLSQDYSTSTPLQQKKFQKLGMQINSSIIDTSTTEIKKSQNKSKTELSEKSQSEASSEDDSEDEVDSSHPRNSLLDDEAEVASDDYESGDSQDDEEREYEKENEIVERGETLDSDDEVSNDTDYEKDSFVVSSDEEDNELLSGSGDDLSMSDNELTMSKKSKKKYNERKLKDQKKASREMYEARHKLDTSDPSLKSRKSKRQKIESSEESSDEETIAPVKRNKLRLDSTQDESLNKSNTNDSKLKNKSKRKRLSESVCDENANIEHEITVYGDDAQNNDPLSVQVKLEPKTPMKDMNISTVQINDNIEEVCVDNNVSVMKSNETADPLQATMLGEDSCSSISENSEIANNYDSVLKELNNDKPTKLKSLDMSLNLNKKTKQSKQPIIDQLNITNTKMSKKKKKPVGSDEVDSAPSNKSQSKEDSSANPFEESSTSDSIDLQLLFSEDSNDFDASQKSFEKKEAKETEKAEDFIPLKRTPGKMNILTSEDNVAPAENQRLNESVKNKKRKSKGPVEEQVGNDSANNNDIQIIIDTQGTRESINKSLNISLNTSTKKKNKKINVTCNESLLSMLNVSTSNKDEMPEEVPYESNKNKKKNRKSSETNVEEPSQVTDIIETEDAPEEVKSKKKNRKSSETYLEAKVTTKDDDDVPEEIPFETSKSKKKNRKSSETNVEEEHQIDEVAEKSMNNSVNMNSAKKKKKNSESQNEQSSEIADTSFNHLNVNSAKKKKKNSESQNEQSSEVADTSINNLSVNSAKKKKKKNSESQNEQSSEVADTSINNLNVNSAKKKKNSESQKEQSSEAYSDDTNTSVGSAKKHKNKSANNSQMAIEDEGYDADKSINVSVMTDSTKKKKKKLSITLEAENIETNVNNVEEISENSKKRKRKSSANQDSDNVNLEGQTPSNDDSVFSGSQKKKIKMSQNDAVQISDADRGNNGSQKKKSKTLAENEHPEQNQDPEPKKKNKKRKERDDDDGNKTAKVFKESSFDNVHIPRLPSSILNQLDDKPKKEALEMKKSSVVSTTPFVVEDTRKRRNKPSAFLEESVYLNDSHIEKKKKVNIKKPKVLPFIPTAVTSGSGFTTNFKINVIPQEVQFVAQSNNVANFKNDYLYGKRIKRLGTYETYKKHRSAKMSKF